MKAQIIKFLKEEDGITALEYGVLAALVAAAILLVFGPEGRLGTILSDLLDKVATAAGVGGGGTTP